MLNGRPWSGPFELCASEVMQRNNIQAPKHGGRLLSREETDASPASVATGRFSARVVPDAVDIDSGG